MKNRTIKLTGCTVILSMFFTSCAEIANDPALSGLVGGGAGALLGNEIGGKKGALIGGAAGALIGVAISKHYRANEAQKREAERQARQALAKRDVKSNLQKGKAKYVAVPVSRASGQGGSSKHLMKVDAETGKPTGDVYIPKAGTNIASGSTVNLGGDKALYYGNSIQGI